MSKRRKSIVALFAMACTLLIGCSNGVGGKQLYEGNAIYHWKNTLALTDAEKDFLKNHDVRRMYVRFFDVENISKRGYKAIPTATVKFLQEAPEGVEIVPTVFITTEAMRSMANDIDSYAGVLYKRLKAMAKANGIDSVREVQLDCDWAGLTKDPYFRLCQALREQLNADSIRLSSTIRLHQLEQEAPPVDCGVLMLYNTGNVSDIETANSILSFTDVAPYFKNVESYALPLSFAYPAFAWKAVFYKSGYFKKLSNMPDSILADTTIFELQKENRYRVKKDVPDYGLECDNIVRDESPTTEEIVKVKKLVDYRLGRQPHANIIYHLDESQLNRFNDKEIDRIYE